jgi:hypothetical protein
LPQADGNRNRPRHLIADRFSAQPAFHRYKEDSANKGGPRHGRRGFGQFEIELLQNHTANSSEEKRDAKFQQVIARSRFLQVKEQLLEPAGEDKRYREHGTALDDGVEQIGLFAEPLLREEEMPGRGNRQELRHPLDDAENDDFDPVRHRTFRRENSASGKPQMVRQNTTCNTQRMSGGWRRLDLIIESPGLVNLQVNAVQ